MVPGKILWLALLFHLTLHAFGQGREPHRISGSFHQTTFPNFVRQVETTSQYRFFYDLSDVDSLVVDLNGEYDLDAALKMLFDGTDLSFIIDYQTNVFITSGHKVRPLPLNFLGEAASELVAEDSGPDFMLEMERQEKTKLLAESIQIDIGDRTSRSSDGSATIVGYVTSLATGEPLVGASVFIRSPFIGATSDPFGYFALTLPKGNHELQIQSLGMKPTFRKIRLFSDGNLDIELADDVTTLKEIIVQSDLDRNITSTQMGLDRLDIKTMKAIPVALGEVDILKAILTLPGVQTVGEATTGLNVRGGAADQNLILLDDATIYNPTHLFGFFSAFNADLVRNVELFKSGIPVEYGGRLSSVLSINTREGSKKEYSVVGGIGPVTGRLTVEGPIVKDKGSFLIGGRSTYSDWLLNQIPNDALKHSQASFYDANINLNYQLGKSNTIYLSGYNSRDRFTLNSDTAYSYKNKAATLKWKHDFSDKLYGVMSAGYSGYEYQINSDKNPADAFVLDYSIDQTNLKFDFNYFPVSRHSVNAGASSTIYSLAPGSIFKNHPASEIRERVLDDEQGIESAVFIGDQFDISKRLSVYMGVRYTFFNYLGPRTVYAYREGESMNEASIIDSVSYRSGKSIARYSGPEFRLSAKYGLNPTTSLKLSYNRTRQYIQVLSNTTAISPTDIWKLSDTYIKPQVGDQISLGLYKNLRSNTIETSVEAYYKGSENTIDYKGGAELLLNEHIETDIIGTVGKAYGVEFLLKRMRGKLNGWFSYTYSRSLLRSQGEYSAEIINQGEYYPSNYDKPHAVNVVSNYRFTHRLSTSMNLTYSTGRPITIPIGQYYSNGSFRTLYGPRNGDRIPDYFRIDLSVNIEGNHRIRKLAHSSWTLGVYNLTGRKNAYSVFFKSEEGVVKGYKLSILGSAIPTITYNFKF